MWDWRDGLNPPLFLLLSSSQWHTFSDWIRFEPTIHPILITFVFLLVGKCSLFVCSWYKYIWTVIIMIIWKSTNECPKDRRRRAHRWQVPPEPIKKHISGMVTFLLNSDLSPLDWPSFYFLFMGDNICHFLFSTRANKGFYSQRRRQCFLATDFQ